PYSLRLPETPDVRHVGCHCLLAFSPIHTGPGPILPFTTCPLLEGFRLMHAAGRVRKVARRMDGPDLGRNVRAPRWNIRKVGRHDESQPDGLAGEAPDLDRIF